MEIKQCWSYYIKAEELNGQGHWPEAYKLYGDVLDHMPKCIETAISCDSTKPCQLLCMLDGFRTATVHQSEILNNLGKDEEAFYQLNQTYSYIQFLRLESSALTRRINPALHQHGEELFRYIVAFCTAQRSAKWMLELESIQKAHHHFHELQPSFETPVRLN